MEDQKLIRRIKEGDEKALRHIYETNRKGFLDFALRFGLAGEDVLDIYQDSIIAFYENVRKGRLDILKSTIATYIFAIGKYKIYALLKMDRDEIHLDELSAETLYLPQTEEDSEDTQVKLLQQAFKTLGSKCREILTFFYYEGIKLEEIPKKNGLREQGCTEESKVKMLEETEGIGVK